MAQTSRKRSKLFTSKHNKLTARTRYGLSFIGRAWSEAELIGYAYAYEQRTMVRNTVLPYIQPNIELSDVVGANSSTKIKRHAF